MHDPTRHPTPTHQETSTSDHLDARPTDGAAVRTADGPLLVEDVLLLLFQPDSGTISGESSRFYVLGGAVLGGLALTGRVQVRKDGL